MRAMLASSAIAVTLALLADPVRAVQDEPAIAIRTVDEALEQLPPIGRDGTWKGKNPIIHPAAAWLKEYIATGGELIWRHGSQLPLSLSF